MEDLDIKELEKILKKKKSKKKMKTGKKAFWLGFMLSISLIVFSGIMVIMDKDTQTVAIFAGAGVAVLPFIFGIYEHFSTKINLKHMEKGYNPDYDDEKGLY